MKSTTCLLIYLAGIIAAILPCPSFSLYDAGDDVVTFTSTAEFKTEVLSSDSIWLIQFYSPHDEYCRSYATAYKHIATVLKGIMKVAAIDMKTEGPLKSIASDYKVSDIPTILMFADDKMKPTKYEGDRDPQSLINAILQLMMDTLQNRATPFQGQFQEQSTGKSSAEAVTLTSATMGQVYDSKEVWLVAFIAPWCGHCKKLLPEWHTAAGKLQGSGANLAIVDATADESLAAQYQIQGFPTIKVFPGGDKSGPGDAQEYMGGREEAQIVGYALEEVDRTGVPKELVEMTSLSVLKENCDQANKICILAALPHILETMAEGRRKYIDLLQTVNKSFRTSPVDFLWFEGSSQLKLEEALQMTFGFPAVVALSMHKNVYSVMHGSFTEKSISKFITSIVSGRASVIKLDAFPKVETVEPWNGEDGVPFEEEPLDDIMGWDDEM